MSTRLIKKPAQLPSPQGQPPSFVERMESAKTAFLSIPKYLADTDKIISSARSRYPYLTIRTFAHDVEDRHDWRKRQVEVIGQCDVLILAIDSSRVMTPGVFREYRTARTLKKLVSIFNISTGKRERVFGYERDKENNIVRLRPKPAPKEKE